MVEQTPGALTRSRFIWARPGQKGLGALCVEFALLFVAIPIAIALFLPPTMLFPALFAFSALGLILLWRTGGLHWRDVTLGWGRFDWRLFAAFAGLTFAASVLVLYLTRPEALFSFLRRDPRFLLLIWALYPLLSALPQELIFRVLFFHRYGRLFSGPRQAVLVNAALFSVSRPAAARYQLSTSSPSWRAYQPAAERGPADGSSNRSRHKARLASGSLIRLSAKRNAALRNDAGRPCRATSAAMAAAVCTCSPPSTSSAATRTDGSR